MDGPRAQHHRPLHPESALLARQPALGAPEGRRGRGQPPFARGHQEDDRAGSAAQGAAAPPPPLAETQRRQRAAGQAEPLELGDRQVGEVQVGVRHGDRGVAPECDTKNSVLQTDDQQERLRAVQGDSIGAPGQRRLAAGRHQRRIELPADPARQGDDPERRQRRDRAEHQPEVPAEPRAPGQEADHRDGVQEGRVHATAGRLVGHQEPARYRQVGVRPT